MGGREHGAGRGTEDGRGGDRLEGNRPAWSPSLQGRTPLGLLEDLCPRLSPQVSYHHAATEAAGNGSTPCIFTHSTPQDGGLGQIIRCLCVCCGGGRMRYMWGKGLNTKKVVPLAHVTEAAHANTGRSHWAPFLARYKVTGKHHEKQ